MFDRMFCAIALAISTGLWLPGPQVRATNALPEPGAAAPSQPPLREVSPGVFQIGLVTLDKEKRTVSFPGSVNMDEGVVEYVLVSATGKLHESVLKTDAEPTHVHLAVLLLTGKTEATPAGKMADPTLAGETVFIRVRFRAGGEPAEMPVEDLVLNTETQAPMSRGEWIYNGSRLIEGVFIAQRDGSIISTIRDPDALINNPRPGRDNDEIWHANQKVTPPVNTPVEIIVQLGQRTESDDAAKEDRKKSNGP
jgi:hypothetical protein